MVELVAKVDPKSEAAALEVVDPFIRAWTEQAKEIVGQLTQGLKEAGGALRLTVDIKISGLYPEKKAE